MCQKIIEDLQIKNLTFNRKHDVIQHSSFIYVSVQKLCGHSEKFLGRSFVDVKYIKIYPEDCSL